MALQSNITWKGVAVENAYVKVTAFSGDKNTMTFSLGYFASADEETTFGEERRQCALDLDGDNPVKQAYENLKTLEEFSGATDV
jgi:hypothetical protein